MNFNEQYSQTVERIFAEDVPGFEIAKDFCLGKGKRIRPRLLLDAVEKWGGDMEKAIQAAVAVELLHQYLLIHDDLMDRDKLRSGYPTVYAAAHDKYGVEDGEGVAIAVGDYLANETMELFNECDPKLLPLVFFTIRKTIHGQLSEYLADSTWPIEGIEKFYSNKTALYTFALPLKIADALSPSEDRSHDIKEASQHLGIAFQYRDDLREFQGKKKRDEKGERDDFSRGKMTIINRVFLDNISEDKQNELKADWKEGMTSEKVATWKSLAAKVGVIELVDKLIAEHVNKAKASIQALKLEEVSSLRFAINYITEG